METEIQEVLPIKEGATPFNRAALKTSVDSGGDTPSMNNILSELPHVKGISRFSSRNNPDICFSSRDTSEMTYAEILAEQAAVRARQEQVKAKKNELAAVGATNNLRGLAANVKFISDGIVTQDGANVNGEKFSDVVVPDTASQRLLEELSKLGIPYQLYEAENEDQRQQPINSMDNIRFSQRIGAEERVERMETEIQYLKKLVQIQRMGEVA